jgi:RND family efflux transporter MFP subunit
MAHFPPTPALLFTATASALGLVCATSLLRAHGAPRAESTVVHEGARPGRALARILGDREDSLNEGLEVRSAFVGVLLPQQATDVSAPQSGLVEVLHAELGALVTTGDPLVTLSGQQATFEHQRAAAEREAARALLARARIEYAHAQDQNQRAAQLEQERLITSEELAQTRFKLSESLVATDEAQARLNERTARADQLAALQAQTRVTANFRGRVALRYVTRGTLVPAGAPLLRLISDDAVLRFAIPEQVTDVRVGSHVAVVPQQQPDATLTAVVVRVAPEIDAASRMRTIEAAPTDPARVVEQGLMGALVSVRICDEAPSALPPDRAEPLDLRLNDAR